MKVLFKRPREIDGVLYTKGTHEVPDETATHWFFLAIVQNGVAVILEGPKGKKVESSLSRSTKDTKPTPVPEVVSYNDYLKAGEAALKKETATQAEATKMIQTGEATIPKDSTVDEKSAKRIAAGKKAAATRAAKQAQGVVQ